ncbi:unnamed protein product [Mesocestoides corti]|uniref:Uncharacterized protein n=1 Tax=Mesocestoides corti TaxID=53468 RepID=A0A0R3UPV4_MESCO|nr:unnamed protein product [Mesocestoides corti]
MIGRTSRHKLLQPHRHRGDANYDEGVGGRGWSWRFARVGQGGPRLWRIADDGRVCTNWLTQRRLSHDSAQCSSSRWLDEDERVVGVSGEPPRQTERSGKEAVSSSSSSSLWAGEKRLFFHHSARLPHNTRALPRLASHDDACQTSTNVGACDACGGSRSIMAAPPPPPPRPPPNSVQWAGNGDSWGQLVDPIVNTLIPPPCSLTSRPGTPDRVYGYTAFRLRRFLSFGFV